MSKSVAPLSAPKALHWIALSSAPETAASADQPADLRTALAWWALSYTPRVALLDEAVLMEVSASARLWGGRARLQQRIFELDRPQALLHAAFSATSLQALGLLRLAAAGAARPTDLPADLPLSVLTAARPHLATLARIGCRSWSDLRALPRAGVARRFGAALLDALDTAWGHRPEMHTWVTLPERFDATFELPALTSSAPALLFGAQRLLHQFRVWLSSRQLGVLAFELSWRLDARRANLAFDSSEPPLVIRTALATQELAHLVRLLSERLARVRLAAPVQTLRLRSVETARLAPQSARLLPEDRRSSASNIPSAADLGSLQQLAERLGARLGSAQVLHPSWLSDHRPESMQHWQPMTNALQLVARQQIRRLLDQGTVARTGDGSWLPTWLLREPLPLATQHDHPRLHGPLQLLTGPDRIEVGWWAAGVGAEDNVSGPRGSKEASAQDQIASRPALRDYFIAHDVQAGLLWIYRERLRRAEGGCIGCTSLGRRMLVFAGVVWLAKTRRTPLPSIRHSRRQRRTRSACERTSPSRGGQPSRGRSRGRPYLPYLISPARPRP